MTPSFFKKFGITIVCVALMGTMAFQCSSPNITAGKLYFQQYQSSQDSTKLNMAIQQFQKEVNENPNSAEGWYYIGIAQGMKQNFAELRSSWMKASDLSVTQKTEIKKNSMYMWVQSFNYGTRCFQKAQSIPIESRKKALFAEAEEAYLTANYLLPDTSAKYSGYSYLANVYLAQGRVDDAIKALNRQNTMNPNPTSYITLGKAYILQGDNLKKEGNKDGATKKYDEAISILTDGSKKLQADNSITDSSRLAFSSELNQVLLNAYIASDRLNEAKDIFKSNAETNTSDPIAQFNYGTILLQNEDYEGAVTYLDRAIALKPEYPQALQNAIAAYLRLGFKMRDAEDENSSEQAYKKVIEKAVPHTEALIKLQPNDAVIYDLAAKVYASIGNNEKANEMFKKADELRQAE